MITGNIGGRKKGNGCHVSGESNIKRLQNERKHKSNLTVPCVAVVSDFSHQ